MSLNLTNMDKHKRLDALLELLRDVAQSPVEHTNSNKYHVMQIDCRTLDDIKEAIKYYDFR